jgi:hypothetical protein
MRLSSPMPRETSNTSASTRSQRSAMPRNRFAVVSNPEFLREGAAIEDFKQPERVIGVEDDERARLVIAKIYEPLSLFRAPASSGRSRATPPRSKRASSTVYRTKRRFVLGNLEAALSEEPPPEQTASSRARRKPCWWQRPVRVCVALFSPALQRYRVKIRGLHRRSDQPNHDGKRARGKAGAGDAPRGVAGTGGGRRARDGRSRNVSSPYELWMTGSHATCRGNRA